MLKVYEKLYECLINLQGINPNNTLNELYPQYNPYSFFKMPSPEFRSPTLL